MTYREMTAYRNGEHLDTQAVPSPENIAHKAMLIRLRNRGATHIWYDGVLIFVAPLPDASVCNKRAAFVAQVVEMYRAGMSRYAICKALRRNSVTIRLALREGGVYD